MRRRIRITEQDLRTIVRMALNEISSQHVKDLITEITQGVMKMILSESYNPDNFFKNTQAVFTESEVPKRKPDYISTDRYGCVSSEYWYTDEGVYRKSWHWSLFYINGKRDAYNPYECYNIRSCWWILDAKDSEASRGFCPWSDFLPFDGKNLNIEALENKMKHKVWRDY